MTGVVQPPATTGGHVCCCKLAARSNKHPGEDPGVDNAKEPGIVNVNLKQNSMKALKSDLKKLDLGESVDRVSNDLFFHPHPLLEKIWVETSDACSLLGMNRRTLYSYRQKGMISCTNQNGHNFYPAAEVEELMKYLALKRA